MSEPLFRQIGPYEIRRQIGRGGMAMVFLADDTRAGGRTVALKVLPDGPADETHEIAEAERRGAELQQQFLATSGFVPELYEVGETEGYLYIAMEYLEGEDLSTLIRRGPVEPTRAANIAIQLCHFLEEIDHLAVNEASALTLLHNDLKPTNIRIVAGDRVKVLDFGAAKALSMSRRVTRNDFYSTPYLSPECLDSGERDRQTDAWALGVILYETVAGTAPFRADDTRRLEDRIRSRRPPPPIPNCPLGLQAIIAKLLAPEPSKRYQEAAEIRADLERCVAGTPTNAEAPSVARAPSVTGVGGVALSDSVREEARTASPRSQSVGGGAPTQPIKVDQLADEPPTRRVPRLIPEAPSVAREPRSGVGGGALFDSVREEARGASPRSQSVGGGAPTQTIEDEPATRRVPGPTATVPAVAPPIPTSPPNKSRRWLRIAVVLALLTVVGNEACVFSEARRTAATVPMQEFAGLDSAWDQFERLRGRSYLGVGAHDLGLALRRQSVILAERVAANYRTPAPTVREAQWEAAAKALQRALIVAPNDNEIQGTLRYAQGQLRRIDGEADKARKQLPSAQRNFAEAVSAFREAASLRRGWPDPFLGLARTFIYGLEDIDHGADAMSQAQKLGHSISPRETAQLADGYAARSESLNRASSEVRDMPQERDFLTRSREACQKALELYSTIPDFIDVPAHIRMTQRRLEIVERKLADIEKRAQPPAETIPGATLGPTSNVYA